MFDTRPRSVSCFGLTVLALVLLGCTDSGRVLDDRNAAVLEGLYSYEATDAKGEVIVTGTVSLSPVDDAATSEGRGEFRLTGAWSLLAATGVDPGRTDVQPQTGEGSGVGGQIGREFWFVLDPSGASGDIRLEGQAANGRIVGRWGRADASGPSGLFVLHSVGRPVPARAARSVLDHPL